ncbi:hypothetical protein [Brevibacillus sp. FIR094]|uniref:hypothetical protein n=1 Tax=Brevibacillus sp. FIR094 TaxID=3134809 RepID=UPI003D224E5D
MGWFDWIPWRSNKSAGGRRHSGTQSRSGGAHPFDALRGYAPNKVQVKVYKQMRDGVPIIGVGIQNLRRLIGTPKIVVGAPNSRRQKEWDNWVKTVKVGKVGKGFGTFISSFVDALIQNGFSAAEIVPNRSRTDIYALLPIVAENVVVKNTEDPTVLVLAERQPMEPEPVVYPVQDWIVYTAYEPEPENPYGKGLLTGLPFIADILLTIFYATGRNWERFGDLKYSLGFEFPQGTRAEDAKKFIEEAQKSWSEAMKKTREGKVQDFFGSFVKVSVIGADAKQLEMEVPARTLMEQIVAKTGLPPFIFGFSWAARETMTKTQADFLTSLIDDWREMVNPSVAQVAEWWLKFHGYPLDYEVHWDEVTLADIEGLANAELINARAEGQRLQNIMVARDMEEQGYIEPEIVEEMIEARKKKPGGKAIKRMTKDGDSDLDPERLPQKERDSKRIARIAGTFETSTIRKLRLMRERLFSFMEEHALAGKSLKTINPDEIQAKVEEELNNFLADLILGRGDQLAVYDTLLHEASISGFRAAVEDIRREINPEATIISNYDPGSTHVRVLRSEGMARVVTKAQEIKEACIDVMERHAAIGDNQETWATSLQSELGEQLDEPRWYWRRLARSEAAMMFDRAAEEEYLVQEIEYVKWIVSPDACRVCRRFANKIFPLQDSPRTVKDTHPHCRCRKMAVTETTAVEAQGTGTLIYFDRGAVERM